VIHELSREFSGSQMNNVQIPMSNVDGAPIARRPLSSGTIGPETHRIAMLQEVHPLSVIGSLGFGHCL